ncbi:NADH-ubiquinone oxidoreductase [Halomonas sp. MCCC 1A17488]|uniref:complex I subunit 5 family protein n=1 Tax=unclassified Halomonas TaxID=2609666 RepID=UPI0018D25283|nr:MULTISPECIES: proton-conducting transporter membrane subunit [unclassified Halomonas]MCE8016173.1 NADH-ubiquinone oxidoreductase [Halomonas sp. MCCC 1A17488]MCG3239506.1 NADH-ubiquinone oxidoreductase [Halomonas sp. MCCC 1A17488]QPP50573.1 NADH-ubiquinone oxidoreductase [Halomonas sp. SS10-MC5]
MIERLGLATDLSGQADAPLMLYAVLGLPLLLGLLGGVLRPARGWPVALVGLLPLSALGWLTAASAGGPGQSGTFEVGSLMLHWRLNGLTLVLLLLTQAIVLASALYAPSYLREMAQASRRGQAGFWPLLGVLAASLSLIWVAADLLLLYIGLEVMGLAVVGLLLLPGKADALVAGLRYLLLALVGSLAYLLGSALLLGAWGRLDLAGLAEAAEPGALPWVAVALLSAGLLLKAAVFPLHAWLVPVHGAAWIPISALHAGLVVKASFFIALQLWLVLVPAAASAAALIGVMAAGAVTWGGVMAWRAATLKEVVAWSTVSQLGYLLLAFPLLVGSGKAVAALAWDGTWLQLAAHGLAKAAMFLAAGNLILATGEARVEGLAGASRRFPLSLLSFGMAAISLVGLPPSMGFTAKWLLLHAALAGGHWAWMAVLAIGTLLSAAYVFRIFRYSFIEDAPESEYRRVPWGMELIALLLALAALLLGLAADWPLSLLRGAGGEP